MGQSLEHIFEQLIKPFRVVTVQFNELILGLARRLATLKDGLTNRSEQLMGQYTTLHERTRERLRSDEQVLRFNDPMRQLRLGFSILMRDGKVLRDLKSVEIGESFEARLTDGTLEAQVVQKKSIQKSIQKSIP